MTVLAMVVVFFAILVKGIMTIINNVRDIDRDQVNKVADDMRGQFNQSMQSLSKTVNRVKGKLQ